MKKSIVGRLLSLGFYRLGVSIGKHPVKYLCIIILFTILQSLGWLRFHHLQDFNVLFMTETGRSAKDMNFIEKTFPLNVSEPLDVQRMTKLMRNGIIMITAKDGGTLFREELTEEILSVYDEIYNTSVGWNGTDWNFSSICSPWWYGHCIVDTSSEVLRRLQDFNKGKFCPTYPVDWTSYKTGVAVTAMNFGGVTTDDEKRITSAKAMRFFFQLEYRDEEKSKISQLWEEKFVEKTLKQISTDLKKEYVQAKNDAVLKMETKKYKNIELCIFTLTSIAKELTRTTLEGIPFGFVSVTAIFIFAVSTSFTSDPVKSKPWLGIAGGSSALLGLVSGFGFLFMVGMSYIDILLTVPFVMLGIGIDDSFVLVASWRRTNSKDSVPNRMGKAFSEAAMSITITSFTNFLSFLIGIATPYLQTQIYAIYCATSVLFCYLYQIIFFGACMALSGYREEKRLHCLTFRKVPLVVEQTVINKEDNTENCEDTEDKEVYSPLAMVFLRDRFSNILINKHSRVIVVLMFVLYWIAAGIGCSSVIDGPDYRNGFLYGSHGWKYTDWIYRYFGDYPHRVQVVINEELDYSDPIIQGKTEELIELYETASFSAGSELTEYWLRSYKDFLNSSVAKSVLIRGFNTSNPQEFYYVLQNIFFKIPIYRHFSSDVVFGSNYTTITQSRFIIQTKNIHNAAAEKSMLEDIYHVVDSSKYNTIAFNYFFRVIEQSILTKSVTIQTVLCTASAMILVFLILIPNLRCVVVVAFCLGSIEIGVVGFMSFWSVNLDPLSLVCLIMCVGFSVDFASHVTYSYVNSNECSIEGRIRYSMYSSGMPVLQSAGSTIVGVVFLVLSSSNSFVVIFKVIFLSIVFACLHSMFLLPILLSLVFKKRTTRQFTMNDELKKLDTSEKVTVDELLVKTGKKNKITF